VATDALMSWGKIEGAAPESDRPVAVIGAGTMGRGIAYIAAVGGFEVRLVDIDPSQLEHAEAAFEAALRIGVERGKVETDLADRARGHLTTTTDLPAACRGAGLVVEAVVERLEVKREVLSEAEQAAPGDSVLGTNTSALSVTEIASGLADPPRCVGMHFFNPVAKMPLCELVIGLETTSAVVETAAYAATRMGKRTIRVRDVPGFATSRLNALIGNEGFRMLEQGVASPEDIDAAARLGLNHPMGPLEMADLVGLDVRLSVLEHLEATLGDRFRPTAIHRQLVAAGRLGRKAGRGVYRYDDEGERVGEPSDLGSGPVR
jgi:3-hydroxybutyryl-CoA dehydrogenase